MVMTTTVDMTKLAQSLRRYETELGMSLPKVVKYQAGLFKQEVVNSLPPRNRKKSSEQAVKDTKKVFFAGKEGTQLHPFFGPKAEGNGIRWLYAGDKYLVGAYPDDWKPGMSVVEMQREMSAYRNGLFRGAGWHKLKKRGNQYVYRINRTIIRRGELEKLRKQITANFGKLKASFAVDWEKFQIARALPAWIRKHLPEAKGRTLDMAFGSRPFVELISNAHGVTKPQAIKAIQAATKKRVAAMAADIRNQLKGVYKRAGFANAK